MSNNLQKQWVFFSEDDVLSYAMRMLNERRQTRRGRFSKPKPKKARVQKFRKAAA